MRPAVVERTKTFSADSEIFDGDLDQETLERALETRTVAWDTETTGLDWRTARIGTVQVQIGELSCVVLMSTRIPHRLKQLLETTTVRKVMHHAMFDLRFAASHWKANPRHIACTKIASKLLSPQAPAAEHSLAHLVSYYFGATLDKKQRLTDWTKELTPSQLQYAIDDVRHLLPLHDRLAQELQERRLIGLRDRCYEHLPTRVELELRGYCDVYDY
jgi:ribonuclease D